MIYLIRHGQDDNTVLGGWSMSGLIDEGIKQAKTAAEIIAQENHSIQSIYSSDLPRAAETASIIGNRLGLDINFLPEFREMNNGLLAGIPRTEAAVKYPDLCYGNLQWDECFPNGESPHLFFQRISSAWQDMKNKTAASEGNVLLVTHGGVINIIYCIEHGIPYTNKKLTFRAEKASLIKI